MTDFTRRQIRKLKPEARHLIEDAAAKGDLQELTKWIREIGNHLPIERQAQIIVEAKQIVADESVRGRRRRKR